MDDSGPAEAILLFSLATVFNKMQPLLFNTLQMKNAIWAKAEDPAGSAISDTI